MARAQAEIAFPLTELIGILIVAIVVGSVIIFIARSISSSNSQEETASIYSMFSLAHNIDLLADNQELSGTSGSTIFVSDDVVLIGFPEGRQGVTYYKSEKGKLSYVGTPDLCGQSSCLCLFRAAEVSDDKRIACVQLKNVNQVLSFWNGVKRHSTDIGNGETLYAGTLDSKSDETFKGFCYPYPKESYETLPPQFTAADDGVFGCGTNRDQAPTQYASLVVFGGKTQEVAIEKVVTERNVHILVNYPLSKTIGEKRKADIQLLVDRQLRNDKFQQAEIAYMNAYTDEQHQQAIVLYEQFLALSEGSSLEKERVTARNHILWSYVAMAQNLEEVMLKDASRENVLAALRARSIFMQKFDGDPDLLFEYNVGQNEFILNCNKWKDLIAGDTVCASVPMLAPETNLEPEADGACVGTMTRCGDTKISYACVNSKWTASSCATSCTNVLASLTTSCS